MRLIQRARRFAAALAGLAASRHPSEHSATALANPGGAASTSPGVCPALGWLSFRRIVDIPFEACVAALESWQRTGQDGEVQIGQNRLRGPIKHDRDSGTCRIEARLARGPGRVRPTAAYFRAGHLLLDSLTHSLPQHVPTHARAAAPQSSHTRITANPFLANGCQEQATLRGRQ